MSARDARAWTTRVKADRALALEVDVKQHTARRTNVRNALDLDVPPGRTVCLVAEAGSVQVAWHAQAEPFARGTSDRGALQASRL